MTNKKPTNKELLIRIDERQRQLTKDMKEIKKCLKTKVDNDVFQELRKDYLNTKGIVRSHEKQWNRLLGYAVGIAGGGGVVGGIVSNIIKTAFARIP